MPARVLGQDRVQPPALASKLIALGALVVITAINGISVTASDRVNKWFTLFKTVALFLIGYVCPVCRVGRIREPLRREPIACQISPHGYVLKQSMACPAVLHCRRVVAHRLLGLYTLARDVHISGTAANVNFHNAFHGSRSDGSSFASFGVATLAALWCVTTLCTSRFHELGGAHWVIDCVPCGI